MIQFTPNSNKFLKRKLLISFYVLGNFKITDPKNIMTFIFKSAIQAISRLFARVKGSLKLHSNGKANITLKVKPHAVLPLKSVAKILVKFVAKTNTAVLKLQDNLMKSILKLHMIPKLAVLHMRSTIRPTLKSITRTTGRFKIISVAQGVVKLHGSARSFYRFQQKNKLTFHCFLKTDGKIKLASKAQFSEKFYIKPEENDLKLRSSIHAIVYRPIKLYTLYPQKIVDWYDKTLEEVFFGTELI